MNAVCQLHSTKEEDNMGLNDVHSLSHSKWNCKYHIVFAPKYRRKVFFGEKKIAIGKILRQFVNANVLVDHSDNEKVYQ